MEATTLAIIGVSIAGIGVAFGGLTFFSGRVARRASIEPIISHSISAEGALVRLDIWVKNQHPSDIKLHSISVVGPQNMTIGHIEKYDEYGDITLSPIKNSRSHDLKLKVRHAGEAHFYTYATPHPSWNSGQPEFCLLWSSVDGTVKNKRRSLKALETLTLERIRK
jgi:hypothetical protein